MTDQSNRIKRADAILDRLSDDEHGWQHLITTVQFELFKSTASNTDWVCPDDIAEDVICAVVFALTDHAALDEVQS
jgi:hypothetical protein